MRYIEKENITTVFKNVNLLHLKKYVNLQLSAQPDPLHPLYSLDRVTKQQLIKQLITEQKGLCCYCMQQFENSVYHIEHLVPQSAFKNEEVNYYNLFLSCGNDKYYKKHCGQFKKENQIPKLISYFNPKSNEKCQDLFKYNIIGEILPIQGEESIKDNYKHYKTLNPNTKSLLGSIEVLNLNCISLVADRRKIADAIFSLPDNRPLIENTITNLEIPNPVTGFLDPMCSVSIFFLKQKLKSIE